eukprot:CAMPEP_0114995214 /NCGR_PEP_ID=MMETSP0216-20121206/13599_1 /TAXON_ID=223996 /ORGANISM="Protocruzia adherens, Strain Boccale" /LENGTH=51 /DNA_ID=CAMNT_0002359219 /DNA_START=918 /DNA_END=1070 /DNA_ORIENTATION=+
MENGERKCENKERSLNEENNIASPFLNHIDVIDKPDILSFSKKEESKIEKN